METAPYEFRASPGTKKVVLPEHFKALCPRCGKSRTIREFGLRNMGDGTVRAQPYCGPCRKLKEGRDG